MENEKRLIDANELMSVMRLYDERQKTDIWETSEVEYLLKELPAVDAVEVARIEEVKQAILQTFDNLIATHRDISNSPFANSAKYLNIPESSNDYNGIYADAMEVARRFVNAALTDLCSYGGGRGGK